MANQLAPLVKSVASNVGDQSELLKGIGEATKDQKMNSLAQQLMDGTAKLVQGTKGFMQSGNENDKAALKNAINSLLELNEITLQHAVKDHDEQLVKVF